MERYQLNYGCTSRHIFLPLPLYNNGYLHRTSSHSLDIQCTCITGNIHVFVGVGHWVIHTCTWMYVPLSYMYMQLKIVIPRHHTALNYSHIMLHSQTWRTTGFSHVCVPWKYDTSIIRTHITMCNIHLTSYNMLCVNYSNHIESYMYM